MRPRRVAGLGGKVRSVSSAELEAARVAFLRGCVWPWRDRQPRAAQLRCLYLEVRHTIVARRLHAEGHAGRWPAPPHKHGPFGSTPAYAAAAARFDPDPAVRAEGTALCLRERFRQLARQTRPAGADPSLLRELGEVEGVARELGVPLGSASARHASRRGGGGPLALVPYHHERSTP